MKRLIVGSLVSVPLLLVACTGDPTESLRGGITQLTTSPSALVVQQGRTAKVDVSAIDEQGNRITTSFDASNIGSGINVSRDLTFQPEFVNDTTLAPPAEAPTFRFNVEAVNLVSTSFQLNAGGKNVAVPVSVTPDPTTNFATVTTAGASAADPTTISLSAPLIFGSSPTVTFNTGAAIVTGEAADGSTLTFFPPPGASSTGIVTGVSLTYLSAADVTLNTDVALNIPSTVPSNPATASINTAPDVPIGSQFFDGAAFTGADISGDGGLGKAQYYKFTLPADGDVNISVNWSNASDVDLVLCADITCSVADFTNATGDQPQGSTYTLTAGTYYIDVVLFAGANPDWISLSVTQ